MIGTAVLAASCGSVCRDIAAERAALARPPAPGPHIQLQLPFRAANALIADTLREQPLAAPLRLPDVVPVQLPELTAAVRQVRLLPGSPDRLRFAIDIEVRDASGPITSLAVDIEVTPEIRRQADTTRLVVGFGPRNLQHVRPRLAPRAERALADAIRRWLPGRLRDRAPRALLDRAAGQAATYLAGAAFDLLRATLLRRVGELTRLELRLPDAPIASVSLRSHTDALDIDLTTDLPVRRGLARHAGPAGDDLSLRVSGSAAAELANWAVERGHLPRRYTRSLAPRPDGAYRPYFDYVADRQARPFVVHIFQERGGCSYFQVGLLPRLSMRRGKLAVTTLDQRIERVRGPAHIELAVWFKRLVVRSVDRTRQLAARTELTIGGRRFVAHAVAASIKDDELRLRLQVVLASRGWSGLATQRAGFSTATTSAAGPTSWPWPGSEPISNGQLSSRGIPREVRRPDDLVVARRGASASIANAWTL